MIKTLKELKTHVDAGKRVYLYRTYLGYVEFRVAFSKADRMVKYECLYFSGYDMLFHHDDVEAFIEKTLHFESVNEWKAYKEREKDKLVNEYKAIYGENKDAFLLHLVKLACKKEMNPEYGDYDTAQAILETAKGYFPDIDLQEEYQ